MATAAPEAPAQPDRLMSTCRSVVMPALTPRVTPLRADDSAVWRSSISRIRACPFPRSLGCWATRARPPSTMLSNAGLVIRRPWVARGCRLPHEQGQLTPPKSHVEVGPRKQKIGTGEQAAARDIAYLISRRPSMTQGPETSYDAGKLALLERSR